MNINDIIVKPIITEKSSNQLMSNVYTFEVNPNATRTDVKRAIELIFAKSEAKVGKVNIIKVRRKSKALGKYRGFTKGYKKAIVTLTQGSIPIYGSEGVENNEKKAIKVIDTDKIMEEASKEA